MKIFLCPYRKSNGGELHVMLKSLDKYMYDDYYVYVIGDDPKYNAPNVKHIDYTPKGKTKEQRVAMKLAHAIKQLQLKHFILINDDIFLTRELCDIHKLHPLYYSGKIADILNRYPASNLYRLTLKNSMRQDNWLNFAVHYPMYIEDPALFLDILKPVVSGAVDRVSFRNLYGNIFYEENGFETILAKVQDCKLFSPGPANRLDEFIKMSPWVSVGDGWWTKENREYLINKILKQ